MEQPEGRPKTEREKYPEEVEMWVVQAREESGSGKEKERDGKKEINWTLYTSHKVETLEEAEKMIGYYKSLFNNPAGCNPPL